MSEPIPHPERVSATTAASGPRANPGSIIRLARQARGETQRQTGQACGFSQSEISRIENGKAHAYDIRHLAQLAQHLDIPPHLLGLSQSAVSQPDSAVNRREFLTGAAAVVAGGAIPGALRTHNEDPADGGLTSRLLRTRWLPDAHVGVGRAPDLGVLADGVARAKTNYQACRYAESGAELPTLLARLNASTSIFGGDELLRANTLAADAYHVAASLELRFGNEGPAWIAADASMQAAERSEDPVMIASSARIITRVLMDARRYGDAETVARRTAEKLAAGWSDPSGEELSVYGILLLQGAIAAARAGDAATSEELLTEASDAADRLGADHNFRWTAFGPTNVLLHRVSAAVAFGNAGVALKQAKRVRFDRIPATERKASFLVDVAGAYLQWGKHEQACNALYVAERFAPQELSSRPTVRQLITDTWISAPAGVGRRMEQLAQRTGVAV